MNTQEYKSLFSAIKTQIKELKISAEDKDFDVIKLKNILENLRSALEWLAEDIKEYYGYDKRAAFPYSNEDEKTFRKYVNQKFPNLNQNHPELYETLKNVQPFLNRHNWLEILTAKTNIVKHKTPRISESKNLKGFNIVGIVDLENLNEDIYIDLKEFEGHDTGSISIKNGQLTVKNAKNIIISGKRDKKGFVFKSEDVEIIPFLEESLKEVQDLAEEIYYHFD